jgi:chromosomal replication initiation ATPase DnaA
MGSERSEEYQDLKVFANFVKGDEAFARTALKRTEPASRRRWSVEQIGRAVAKRASLDIEEMRGHAFSPGRARARAIAGYVARKHGGIPLTRVAEFFHRAGTTLVRDLRRFEPEIEASGPLREEIAAVLQELDGF